MKDVKIQIPDNCDIQTINIDEDARYAVVIFKKLKPQLPKSWEEFCEMFPCSEKEYFISSLSEIVPRIEDESCSNKRHNEVDMCTLPDRDTAEAVLALCQLVQLRNCYNGDWVPDWTDENRKYTIDFYEDEIFSGEVSSTPSILTFKSRELRDEFLRCFRPLIEQLKPLYGIKEGGEK